MEPFIIGLLAATLRVATPLILGTLGELFSERAGILNLGIEGTLFVGAFAGFAAAALTGSLWLGLLAAIGEPEVIDTRNDPRLSRLFSNRLLKRYPAFKEFYGMEDAIQQIVSYFRHAAQGLEERKQVLYLLGPVGGGKSSIAERLKMLMERFPIYALKDSPVNESPLGLFHPERDARMLQDEFGISPRYLTGISSPWALKRLQEFEGDLTRFKVVRIQPSVLKQIAIAIQNVVKHVPGG